MKNKWRDIVLLFFILMGIVLLVPVFKIILYPPGSMGMMLGSEMLIYHMIYVFKHIFWVSLILFGLVGLVWVVINRRI